MPDSPGPTRSRRSPDGGTGPALRRRGARTRDDVLDTAVSLFAARGFHRVTMDDVAEAVGVSRAAVYQYFESKEAVLAAALDEAGRAVLGVLRRLGPLGTTVDHVENLHWWLGEYTAVFDRHAPVLCAWSDLDATDAEVATLQQSVFGPAGRVVAARLGRSGVARDEPGLDVDVLTTGLLSWLHQVHYHRHVQRPDLPAATVLAELTRAVQLALLPGTPEEVITQALRGGDGGEDA